MATDEELRAEAVDRLQARRGFFVHLGVYIIVNAALFLQWAIVTPGAGYWPIWTLFGWGVGLAFHGLAVFVRNKTARRGAHRARDHQDAWTHRRSGSNGGSLTRVLPHAEVLSQIAAEDGVQLREVARGHLDEGEREDRVAVEVGGPQVVHAAEPRREALVVD